MPVRAKKGKRHETLVVASKIKEVVRAAGCLSSADLVEALTEKVHQLLTEAAARAKSNNRSTVRAYDL